MANDVARMPIDNRATLRYTMAGRLHAYLTRMTGIQLADVVPILGILLGSFLMQHYGDPVAAFRQWSKAVETDLIEAQAKTPKKEGKK